MKRNLDLKKKRIFNTDGLEKFVNYFILAEIFFCYLYFFTIHIVINIIIVFFLLRIAMAHYV